MRANLLCLAVLLLGGCARRFDPLPVPRGTPAGTDRLRALEDKLERARTVRIHGRLRSRGLITTDFSGILALGSENRARLELKGEMQGKPAEARLVSDGRTLVIRGETRIEKPTPVGLDAALIIGLTRLGLLHNVVRIAAGETPDHADGTVRKWLTVGDVSTTPSGGGERLAWTISMNGERVGEANLWLDGKTGLPLRKLVLAHTPAGEFLAEESYDAFELDASISPGDFKP
jgi:hypothetical protein